MSNKTELKKVTEDIERRTRIVMHVRRCRKEETNPESIKEYSDFIDQQDRDILELYSVSDVIKSDKIAKIIQEHSEDDTPWGVIDIVDLVESELDIKLSTSNINAMGHLINYFN